MYSHIKKNNSSCEWFVLFKYAILRKSICRYLHIVQEVYKCLPELFCLYTSCLIICYFCLIIKQQLQRHPDTLKLQKIVISCHLLQALEATTCYVPTDTSKYFVHVFRQKQKHRQTGDLTENFVRQLQFNQIICPFSCVPRGHFGAGKNHYFYRLQKRLTKLRTTSS